MVSAGGPHLQSAWCSRSFRIELTPPCHGQALRPSPQPPWARAEARFSLSSMSSAKRPHASRVPPQGQGARNSFLFQRGWTPGRGWNPAGRSGEQLLLAQGDSWPRFRPEVAASYHSHTPTRVPPNTPLHDSATVGLPARWDRGQHRTCCALRAPSRTLGAGQWSPRPQTTRSEPRPLQPKVSAGPWVSTLWPLGSGLSGGPLGNREQEQLQEAGLSPPRLWRSDVGPRVGWHLAVPRSA